MVKIIMVIFKDIVYKLGFNIIVFRLVWIGFYDIFVEYGIYME